jgi:hypothetical protein
MPEDKEQGKFIPVRTEDLVGALCEERALSGEYRENFKKVAALIEAIYHYDFHGTLKEARGAYHIFNPDADAMKLGTPDADAQFDAMVKALKKILVAANYREFPLSELNELMTKAAPKGLKVQVNLDKYEKILIYRRGSKQAPKAKEPLSGWKFRKKKAPVEPETEEIIQRLLILIKLKSRENMEQFYDSFIETAGETEQERTRRMVGEAVFGKKDSAPSETPSKVPNIFLKIFKNVPVSALETLFPDVTVRMTLLDKGLILLPLIGGILSVVNRVIPALLLIGTIIAAVAAGRAIDWGEFRNHLFPILTAFSIVGVITFKIFSKYKITKEKHQAKLMKTLYFHNLDNNAGVFDFLVHEAEEEECKEALLAYYFLLTEKNANGEPFTEEELDRRIEQWMEERFGATLDFEVDDALRKLEEKKLLVKDGERYLVPSLDETLIRLDELWDGVFAYNNERSQ